MTKDRDKKVPQNWEAMSKVTKSNNRLALTVDWEKYASYLEDSNLTEAQKREFLETLWSVIVGFVDLGFDIHPIQQAAPNRCGQNGKIQIPDSVDVVKSVKHLSQSTFITTVGHTSHDHTERTD